MVPSPPPNFPTRFPWGYMENLLKVENSRDVIPLEAERNEEWQEDEMA